MKMKISRIIFLLILALIPSAFAGFGGYMMSFSGLPIIHDKFTSVIVSFLSTFVVLFTLIIISDKLEKKR